MKANKKISVIIIIGILISVIFYTSTVYADCQESGYINKILFYNQGGNLITSSDFEKMTDHLQAEGFCVDTFERSEDKRLTEGELFDEIETKNYSQIWIFDTNPTDFERFNAEEMGLIFDKFFSKGRGIYLVGEQEYWQKTVTTSWEGWLGALGGFFVGIGNIIWGGIICGIVGIFEWIFTGFEPDVSAWRYGYGSIWDNLEKADRKYTTIDYRNQIDTTVKAMLNLDIPNFEVIVGNQIQWHDWKWADKLHTKKRHYYIHTSPYVSNKESAENFTGAEHPVLEGVNELYFHTRESEILLPENKTLGALNIITKKVFAPDPQFGLYKLTPNKTYSVSAMAIDLNPFIGNMYIDASWRKHTDEHWGKGDIKTYIVNIAEWLEPERDAYKIYCVEEFEGKLDFVADDYDANIVSAKPAWGNFDNNISTFEDNCCGDDKEDDLGTIADNGEMLCYNDGYDELGMYDEIDWQDLIEGWAWRVAREQNEFEIKTIKRKNITFDVASNGIKWYRCGSPEVSYGSILPYYKEHSRNMICYEGNNAFAECNPVNDKNKDVLGIDKTRQLGETLTILNGEEIDIQFEHAPAVSDFLDSASLKNIEIEETKTQIKDWTPYETFEFDFYPTNTYDYELLILAGDGSDISDPADLQILFRKSVSDYVVNTPKLDYQHVVIPVSEISNPVDITQIVFFSDATLIPSGQYPLIYIDNMILKYANETRNIYCSDSIEQPWIDDLDNSLYGESACNAYYPSFGWTGSACCGNDNSLEKTTWEYYPDTDAGCWQGNIIQENKTIMEIEFKLNGITKYYVCTSNECEYPLSFEASAEIENLHPDLYSLFIVNETNETLISPTLTTSDKTAKLVAKKIPQQILFFNQTFYGCKASDYIMNNPNLVGGIDNSTPICTAKGGYFCSPDLGWNNRNSSDGFLAMQRNSSRSIPNNPDIINNLDPLSSVEGCCYPTSCWNGTDCVLSQAGESDLNKTYTFPGTNDAYRCINGQWGLAVVKYDWNNELPGYCPQITDCLVDPEGNADNNYNSSMYLKDSDINPICIADNQFIEDHYCINGTWTTRTRYIALQLLNATGTENFTLYCDTYQNALADYSYGDAEDYLGGFARGTGIFEQRACFTDDEADVLFGGDITYEKPCTNNFCILKTDDDVIFGTSLNREIDDNDFSFLYALLESKDKNYCFAPYGDYDYKKCSNSDKIWYNNITNSIIYSKKGIDLEPINNFKLMVNFFTSLFAWISQTWQPKTVLGDNINMTFLEKVKDYNKIYIQKKADKTVHAIIEQISPENFTITVQYENFMTDVCDSVEKLSKKAPYTNTLCNQTGSTFTIISDVPEIWQELTSKLRII